MKGVTKACVKRMQRYLRKAGWYTTAYKIDGVWGSATTKALQGFLGRQKGFPDNPAQSGGMNWATIMALQKYLRGKGLYKRAVDGKWGSYTAQAVMRCPW